VHTPAHNADLRSIYKQQAREFLISEIVIPMNNHEISVKGKILKVPSISINDLVVVVKGKLIKKAEIFDEFWLEEAIFQTM